MGLQLSFIFGYLTKHICTGSLWLMAETAMDQILNMDTPPFPLLFHLYSLPLYLSMYLAFELTVETIIIACFWSIKGKKSICNLKFCTEFIFQPQS
jgi:hypothetical protein